MSRMIRVLKFWSFVGAFVGVMYGLFYLVYIGYGAYTSAVLIGVAIASVSWIIYNWE